MNAVYDAYRITREVYIQNNGYELYCINLHIHFAIGHVTFVRNGLSSNQKKKPSPFSLISLNICIVFPTVSRKSCCSLYYGFQLLEFFFIHFSYSDRNSQSWRHRHSNLWILNWITQRSDLLQRIEMFCNQLLNANQPNKLYMQLIRFSFMWCEMRWLFIRITASIRKHFEQPFFHYGIVRYMRVWYYDNPPGCNCAKFWIISRIPVIRLTLLQYFAYPYICLQCNIKLNRHEGLYASDWSFIFYYTKHHWS